MNSRPSVSSNPFRPTATIDMDRLRSLVSLCLCVCVVVGGLAHAQTPGSRIRGVIVSVDGSALQLKADSGQKLAVKLADRYTVSARSHADLTKIAPGAYLGTTAVPGPDGTLTAVEVHIFPESLRGTGEGHRPMDAAPGSTMTDATVASVTVGPRPPAAVGRTMTNATVAAVAGDKERRMTLRYKGGEKVVAIPKGTPIVMVEAGDPSMLVPGAHVIVSGVQQNDGSLLAERVTVGKDGLIPPL
jgi:outer membrane lipoprotein SlyB